MRLSHQSGELRFLKKVSKRKGTNPMMINSPLSKDYSYSTSRFLTPYLQKRL